MKWVIAAVFVIFLLLLQDVVQRKDAVRRNFPIIGRLRNLADFIGIFHRHYLSSSDGEKLPFNKTTRDWIGHVSSAGGGKIGFGSNHDITEPGSVLFVNAPYSLLSEEGTPSPSVVIGPGCGSPFSPGNIFNISGMGHAVLSRSAIRALSEGAARAGIWLNTGENGMTPEHLDSGCDLIFQVGKAKYERYGVRDKGGKLSDSRLREISAHVRAFEVKLSQGAKPERGGVLPPAMGITGLGARAREIGSDADLLDMIARIRDVTGLPVGFKAAISSRTFMPGLCREIHRRGADSAPDFITVDGGEGGAGEVSQTFADNVGISLMESLPLVVDTLVEHGLHDRIVVIASGKLATSARVAWALCAGANYAVSARGFMFSLGCIQTQKCHLGRCPAGISTHNKYLERGLNIKEKARAVANYANWVNNEIEAIARACGLENARELRRCHARIVQSHGCSESMDKLFPYPAVLPLG